MIRYRKLTVTSNRGITLCHKVVPVISHVLSSTYYWWLYMHISRKQEKKVVTFFVLVILIDIQNICSINSRALAVGLMAWSYRKPIYSSRYQYGLPKMHLISMKPSTLELCSAFNTAGWLGRGYKTIVVLRLFDYSPLLTRKSAVDKQAKSYTCKWKKTVSGQSPSHCSKTLSINRWESLRMSFNRGGTELVSGYCRSV